MSGLFGKKPKEPEPVRMPVQDDVESRAAAERKRREINERGGRASTVLTRRTKGDAGTATYGNSLLGQGG